MFNRRKRIKELEKENAELQQELLPKKLDNTNYAAIFGRIVENQVMEVVKYQVAPYLEEELSRAKGYKAEKEEKLNKLLKDKKMMHGLFNNLDVYLKRLIKNNERLMS